MAEAYSFDAISQMGYLAAKTERIQIGSGIVNVFSRTPALMAMTFAGLDYVSDGRVHLGLGASGPQVIEGFHGVALREADGAHQGVHRDLPHGVAARAARCTTARPSTSRCRPGEGTGLGKPLKLINHPVRADIPIWWASLMGKSVEATAAMADGWLPIMFVPERHRVWGDAAQGRPGQALARPGPLEIGAGGMVAIGEDLVGRAGRPRSSTWPARARRCTSGGMGARGKNFYNDVARRYGYEEEAIEIQDLYLDGKKDEAAAAVPAEWLEKLDLVGPPSLHQGAHRARSRRPA